MDAFEFENHTITLIAGGGDAFGIKWWAWIRSDGKKVSPVFGTIQCARAWADRGMPFMTDEEWIQADPGLKLPEKKTLRDVFPTSPGNPLG